MTQRSDFITRPATLDRWEVRLYHQIADGRFLALVHAEGRCERKRGTLWTYNETVDVDERPQAVGDILLSLAYVCTHIRPASQREFLTAIQGNYTDDPTLF